MLIYPDTSDLINLARGRSKTDIATLSRNLAARGHQLTLSMETLIEVSASLLRGMILEVRKDLNQLERMPAVFVNDGAIVYQEYQEAIDAHRMRRERRKSCERGGNRRLPYARWCAFLAG